MIKRTLLLFAAALLLAGCGRTVPAADQSVTMTTRAHEASGERWSSVVSYPSFRGFPDAGQEGKLNDAIRSFVSASERSYAERGGEAKGLPPEIPPYEFMLAFDPYLVNSGVVSLLWSDYAYTGGAHGGTAIIPFLWDVRAARALSVGDLFAPGSNYLEQLSAATRAELKAQHPDWDAATIDEGTAPTEENFSAIALAQDSLTIIFQQYQVGPYVIGTPIVTIPLKRLEKIVNKELADRLMLVY